MPFLLTTLAGLSTGLGGLLAVLLPPGRRTLALCSGFAGGVMVAISLADLAPEALDFYESYLPPARAKATLLLLLLLGVLAAALLARLLPEEGELAVTTGGDEGKAAALRAALVTGTVLLVHNLPEGVLTLFAGVSSVELGMHTALAVALHNIPEGIAVAAPFAFATESRWKGVAAALASGVAEPLGAVLAYWFLHSLLTPALLNGVVALVAGIMLWVSAVQLLPDAFAEGHRTAGAIGVALGCLVMLMTI